MSQQIPPSSLGSAASTSLVPAASASLPATWPQRFPLGYLDKLCLGGASREQGISSAPVWQLFIEGDFDEALTGEALQLLQRRYPLLTSKVISLQRRREPLAARQMAYEVDPEPRLEGFFRSLDLSEEPPEAFERLRQEIFNHYIDLTSEYPVRFTWVRRGPRSGVFFLQQHHSLADGRAFLELLGDFCRYYDQLLTGEPSSSLEPVYKLPEVDVAEPHPWRRLRYRFLGLLYHLANVLKLPLTMPDPLCCNTVRDFTGNNQVLHHLVDDGLLEELAALKERSGFSANDFLCAALGLSLYRWSAALGQPQRRLNVMLPADLRPRDWKGGSLANHLSSYLIDFRPSSLPSLRHWLECVHRQVRHQFRRGIPLKKMLLEEWVSRWLSIEAIRSVVFRAARVPVNLPFSNLVAISPRENGGRFVTRAWQAEALRILTPCGFLQGVNTTLIHYAGQLCFNFNYKESVVERPQVEQLIAHFEEALAELMAEISD